MITAQTAARQLVVLDSHVVSPMLRYALPFLLAAACSVRPIEDLHGLRSVPTLRFSQMPHFTIYIFDILPQGATGFDPRFGNY
jgi:hypothetical protein